MDTLADKDKFLRLIEANKGIIFKICNAYCHNKSDREDVAQEIIYHLWKSGNSFNPDYQFSTWMYRIALNVAISFYRNGRQTIAAAPFTGQVFELEDSNTSPDETEEHIALLHKCINELKELDRALMLLYLEAKTYQEIGEILGISTTNVATKINRIKTKIKQSFQHNKSITK